MVVDRFSKKAHFIACHVHNDAIYIVELFFQEIIRLHGILRSVILDRRLSFYPTFGDTCGDCYELCWSNRWSNGDDKPNSLRAIMTKSLKD